MINLFTKHVNGDKIRRKTNYDCTVPLAARKENNYEQKNLLHYYAHLLFQRKLSFGTLLYDGDMRRDSAF